MPHLCPSHIVSALQVSPYVLWHWLSSLLQQTSSVYLKPGAMINISIKDWSNNWDEANCHLAWPEVQDTRYWIYDHIGQEVWPFLQFLRLNTEDQQTQFNCLNQMKTVCLTQRPRKLSTLPSRWCGPLNVSPFCWLTSRCEDDTYSWMSPFKRLSENGLGWAQ